MVNSKPINVRVSLEPTKLECSLQVASGHAFEHDVEPQVLCQMQSLLVRYNRISIMPYSTLEQCAQDNSLHGDVIS